MQINQRESVSRQNRYLTESRRWCECGRECFVEWAFEGNPKLVVKLLGCQIVGAPEGHSVIKTGVC